MATPLFCCGFECGITAAHWTLNGGATFVTASPINGLRSLRCNPSSAQMNATTIATFGAGLVVFRFKVRFTTLPNANVGLGIYESGWVGGAYFKTSDSKIYAGDNVSSVIGFGTTGVSVTTGVDYWIDVRVNQTANPNLIDVQVNGVAASQYAPAVSADLTAGVIRLGSSQTTNTSDLLIDDVLISTTTGDYPLGDGKVLSFVPNADGTHTCTGTNLVHGTTGTPVGTGITSATTDVFGYVNARPIGGGATDATRLVNQQTVAATEYAEVAFEDTTEVNAPRAVEVLTADRQASTAAGSFTTKLNDNGTENTIIARSAAAGQVTDRWVTKQYATAPADSTAWTLARFNGLKARFGYSGDATPDQYWRGIMIEADFPTSLGPEAFDRPAGQVGANQMNQLLAQ